MTSFTDITKTTSPTIGKDAGWMLNFYLASIDGKIDTKEFLSISRNDYYGELQATLPFGLEGGSYTFMIEGLTDEQYALLKKHFAEKKIAISFYLYWRDLEGDLADYLFGLAGGADIFGGSLSQDQQKDPVAVLSVTSISRKTGSRRYETTIEAREWVFDLLEQVLCEEDVNDQIRDAKLLQGAVLLSKNCGIKVQEKPFPSSGKETVSSVEIGQTYRQAISHLLTRLEKETGNYGRCLGLIRNGELYLGNRSFPAEGKNKVITLDEASGLVETLALEPHVTDPNFDACSHVSSKPPERRQYKLILLGRPDLKPGSIVKFRPNIIEEGKTSPPNIFSALGEIVGEIGKGQLFTDESTGNECLVYINSVDHRLGRTSGFVTTLTCIEIGQTEYEDQTPWDRHSPEPPASKNETSQKEASAEGQAAQAIQNRIREAVQGRRLPEVGEIRQMRSETTGLLPSQTLEVWRGLEPGQGEAFQARRSPIKRPSLAPIIGVPYLTPFAWGKCGLVLPRYPGTRVLVEHRNGQREDPIDVGALWESGKGPDSQPGDWWLSLPAAVPSNQRASISGDAAPDEYTDKVSQDLLDADGNRVIELGELTIRIGRDSLKNAGERPERAAEADSVTIEHVDGGASLVMKSDGTVIIKAKTIQFEATDGDINLTARNVNVKVDGKMDVSG